MKQGQEKLGRRTLLGGAATAGAALGAAAWVRGPQAPAPQVAKVETTRADEGQGYRLTEHVKQYYAKARI